VLRHNDLTGTCLLTRFYWRRMFGYDDLAYLTWPCLCHVSGTRTDLDVQVVPVHMLRHHDLSRLTWPAGATC